MFEVVVLCCPSSADLFFFQWPNPSGHFNTMTEKTEESESKSISIMWLAISEIPFANRKLSKRPNLFCSTSQIIQMTSIRQCTILESDAKPSETRKSIVRCKNAFLRLDSKLTAYAESYYDWRWCKHRSRCYSVLSDMVLESKVGRMRETFFTNTNAKSD